MHKSKSKKVVRVGIVGKGFGTIGLKPAFESVQGSEVVGICSGRDWKTFLERKDLDAVAIAVPPDAQYTIAKAAIQKGLHVFAEKPLAANLKEATDLLVLAKKKKIVHGIDFLFPEIAEWQAVKKLLEKETFGRLRHISTSWDWLSGEIKYGRTTWRSDTKKGGGALSFYFSHGLHYLEHFAGPITTIATQFSYTGKNKNGGETGVDMTLQFKSGATGTAHVSSNTPSRTAHRLVFECERGVIVLENKEAIVDGFTVTIYTDTDERVMKVQKDTRKKGEDERAKIVAKLAKRFVQAIQSKKEMRPSFEDGVRVEELISLARKNA